jgi:hypothetical protein
MISRAQFERRLAICLEKIERGLADWARQKTGYAWKLIVDHMYKKHASDLTFGYIADVMAECAQSVERLSSNDGLTTYVSKEPLTTQILMLTTDTVILVYDEAAEMYARACPAWYGQRAKGVVRQKIKHLQRKGDHGGVVAWTAVAHQLSRIPAADFERDRRS